ncbi:sulfatase-like hydrolase/transferase [Mucisphaera sp.]|uniref:sulfatase-like hydrolase/transferase n=1 Tax=Mucisphaera sp. TaxID=2913024 RepID=UPI003D0BB4B6
MPHLRSTFLAASAAAGLAAGSVTADPTPPPNLVVFFVDDLGWIDNDLDYANQFAGIRGDTDAFFETPHLRDMAADGRTYTQAYASSPVCSPTRASLMLGQSTGTHRVTQFIGGPQTPGFSYRSSLPSSPTTIAEALRSAGYATGYAGKWHLGSRPTQHGFDENYGGAGQGLPNTWFADSQGGFDWATGLPDAGVAFAGEYLTDRLTREAVGFIERSVTADQPFFLDLSHYGVHVPFEAPTAALFNKYHTKLDANTYAQFGELTSFQKDELATYAAMTEAVDISLGAIRQALVDQGVADNTYVVFTSDNGGLAIPDFGNFADDDMNAPLRNGKGTLYEGGIRVPMLLTGPTVAQGVDTTAVVSHDLFPTLLARAGVPLPDQPLDGVDFSQSLAGGPAPDRGERELVIHYPHFSNQGGRPGGAIIDDDWKLIQSYEHGGIELFNLAQDLSETTDLEAQHLRRTEALRVRLHRDLERTSAPLPSGFVLDTRDAGQPLLVLNPSFEIDAVPDNTSGDPSRAALRTPTGWSWFSGLELRNAGVANPDDNQLFGPDFPNTNGDAQNGAMDGPQLAYLGSFVDASNQDVTGQLVGFEQTLNVTLEPNSAYTLRFAAGARSDQAVFVDGLVRLLAGDTAIASYETPHDPNGLLREYQLVVNTHTLDDELFGLPLTLQLLRDTDGGKVSYDNIRLYRAVDLLGDFDDNGVLDADDLADLYLALTLNDPAFDLTGDGQITTGDLDLWIGPRGLGSRPGDSNLDGKVNLIDLSNLATHFGTFADQYQQGDFNGDRAVNLIDLSILATHFGFDAAAVPSPATSAIVGLGLLAALKRDTRARHRPQG